MENQSIRSIGTVIGSGNKVFHNLPEAVKAAAIAEAKELIAHKERRGDP
jgi:hypothetical protein